MSKAKEEMGTLMKELNNNLEADKLYWVRNDAKLRAVVGSKSYEEFRDIVDAAHLKGLSKDDINRKKRNSWNKVI